MSHDLQRFVDAQDGGGIYERALAELRAGQKTSHWMWFVFPPVLDRFYAGEADPAGSFAAGEP
jgi:uncharacterized protein (DUF1810 family)